MKTPDLSDLPRPPRDQDPRPWASARGLVKSRPPARVWCMAIVLGAGLLSGCAQMAAESLLAQARRTLESRYVQDLDNIAMFLVVPDGLPEYMRIHRGTIEARPEPKWSIGTDTFIAGGTRRGIVWEVSAVTDPGDLQRLRLLFQWVTSHIDFDELERQWNTIQDQPEFGADGRQLFSRDGRPILLAAPLPVWKDLGRGWFTTDEQQAVKELDPGAFRKKKVWIKDVNDAVTFTLAVQRAMPNSKPPLALPKPGG